MRSLDQDTIEAVMNGLRSGPLDSFPTGSYDIDDGAGTVFRSADLRGDRNAKFSMSRSRFDPDQDVSTTTMTVIE